jgi:putative hemolysin
MPSCTTSSTHEAADRAHARVDTLVVRLARTDDELEQVFRLRYRVFCEEAGAHRLVNESGLEIDEFDRYCDHLIVLAPEKELVVGTYRLLPGDRPGRRGVYTQTEFDLGSYTPHVPRALEIGRTCVHPDYRATSAMAMLWTAMFRYYAAGGFAFLMGCASVAGDALQDVRAVRSYFRSREFAIDRYGIAPLASHRVSHLDESIDAADVDADAALPTLIKGYLRINGEAASEPAYDPIFDTYDFCMVLETAVVSPAYYRRFFRPVAGGR